jgi:polar amino acid transport system substrate-binding protein
LPGKAVGTITGSTSAKFLKVNGVADAKTFGKVDDAYQALQDKKVDAVVFDAPVLQYYASHAAADIARVTGPVFHPEDYGFVVANGSPLRKEIDMAILDAREDGSYEELTRKWFGAR